MDFVIWFGILIAIVILTVFITTLIVKYNDRKRMEEYQDKILKTQRDEVQNIYQTMRGWRHDYHNHMQTLKAHLTLNQIDEVFLYLDHLEEDLDSIDIAIRTGNVSVDAIVSSKVAMAAKKGIDVNCKAIVPEKLSVSDVDLCVVLGNLLDNAIEACEKITNRKFIRIYIGIFRKQLYISVSNSTGENRRKKLTEFISSKKGNHGHGIRRIDVIAKKYDGFINRKNEPGVFVTEVMLPL